MKTLPIILLFLLSSFYVKAQNVAIGNWDAHLSYVNAISVAEGNNKIYCASPNGLFAYTTSDNSLERFSKVDGMSDVEIGVINFNDYNNKLLVAYENSNIDIINDGTVYNLGDIKRKNILGNKSINNIHFIDDYAYLACGFGIVVVDMTKLEIRATYYIGADGSSVNVLDITSDGTNLYASTASGIYTALLSNANLSNFIAWSVMSGLPVGMYNAITYVNGKVITNFSSFIVDGTTEQDTLFVYDSISWNYFGTSDNVVTALQSNYEKLVITMDSTISVYDSSLALINQYSQYLGGVPSANDAIIDAADNVWAADNLHGLVSITSSGASNYRYPNGPNSSNIALMNVVDNHLMLAPGGGAGSFYNDGIYTYNGESWGHIYGNHIGIVNFDTISDIMNVLIDPYNVNHSFATWGDGLIEFENDVPVKTYNEENSSLTELILPGFQRVKVSGLAMDESGKLWVSNASVAACISTKDVDGNWEAINFSAILGLTPDVRQLIIDKSNQKWVLLYRDGIMVYAGDGEAPSASNTKKLTTATGAGALPSLNVLSMVEDNDGQIWVGTDKGIAVFYSPSTLFLEQNIDAQQILVEEDGNIQLLLETEAIQSIAIDGANRKWIATLSSGVFLMSADGTEQVYHFDESNSPLLSNNVYNIAINHKTGEVFFGTSKGIISFRGTATGAEDAFTDVYSFPNPVKPEYNGPIAIKGLMINSTVKITDISGNLVYETISEGGQAIWNGKNFAGNRVSSGVYMVFCTSEDGASKLATKILFIN